MYESVLRNVTLINVLTHNNYYNKNVYNDIIIMFAMLSFSWLYIDVLLEYLF